MRPLTSLESTIILSSFVLAIELFLLVAYVRVQILNAIKRYVLKFSSDSIDDIELSDSEPVERPNLENMHSTLCLRAYENSSLLAILGYAMSTAFIVYLLSKVGRGGESVQRLNTPTILAGMFLSLAVFICSQWVFFKVAILPFYADIYTRFTGIEIPRLEMDPPSVTLSLLALLLLSVFGLIVTGIFRFSNISWSAVLFEGLVSLLSLGTEIVSWVLIQGFAVPVSETVSAIANSTTAVLWVNSENSPVVAKAELARVLFPDGNPSLSRSSIFSHFVNDNFDRQQLVLGQDGSLEIVSAPESFLWTNIIMLTCVLVLIAAPVFVTVTKTRGINTAVLVFQTTVILMSYAVYVEVGGKSTTLEKIGSGFS
jgi:hypothetical protein